MTFTLPDAFTLIEEGKKSTATQLCNIEHSAQKLPFLMLDHTQFGTDDELVYHLIQALLIAKEANIPLILNRTGQAIDSSTLPSTFQIGLLTSGTTGTPKVQFHTLESILPANTKKSGQSRWLLCYHPMTFAGLQVILQAIVCGDELIASPFSNVQHKAELALTEQCTALSATPSLTRALLLCWQNEQPRLDTITCGGELSDQALLNLLHTTFPKAKIRHIYATTETGVLFSVNDGKEGFPLAYLNQEHHGWTLSVRTNELIATQNGLEIATGDVVEVQDDRVLFNGRLDNSANVGGVKVNLDRLEQTVLNLPSISNARVFAKASPITGAIVCAEIETKDEIKAREEINELNKQLNPAEQLRVVRFVTQITLSDTGKKQRVLTS